MMTKHHLRLILKMGALTLLFFCVCAFESSIWPSLFGSFPTPHIWLAIIVFIIIRWPLYSGIFFSYFLGFILIFYTHAPLKMIWISLNLIYIMIWTLKNRINSTSLLSFATLSAVASILFSIIYILVSSVLEPNPTQVFLLHRITEAGLAFVFSIPTYFICSFIENSFSVRERWQESTAVSSGDLE